MGIPVIRDSRENWPVGNSSVLTGPHSGTRSDSSGRSPSVSVWQSVATGHAAAGAAGTAT